MTTEISSGDLPWQLPGAAMAPPLLGAEQFITTPLLDLLRDSATRAPGAIALSGRTGALTFADLLRLAQNAAVSIASLVPPGQPLACLLPRTPEAMAGLIGCLISGRLCLLLDPANPDERLAALIKDAAPAAMLVEQSPSFAFTAPMIKLRDALAAPDREFQPDHAWDPDAPFAVHFTSGSTGQPKGIVLSARSVLFRGRHAAESFAMTPHDRVFGNGGHADGNGLAVLLGTLGIGARSVLASIAGEGVGAVLRLLEREAVTLAAGQPRVMWTLFQPERAARAFRALRVLRLGAGALPSSELLAWDAVLPPACTVLHTYASTEALVMAQWFVPRGTVMEEPVIAAGMVQPNHECAIIGEDGQPVPIGETGELALRSRYVALGEWLAGCLVSGRMPPVPGRPGWREFRTGDLVRLRPDGMLHVAGRIDRQLKINGVRIEPAEIEAALRAEPRVSDAVVVACTATPNMTLHGFVVAPGADPPDLIASLRRRLAASLPPTSRPSRLTLLPRLPTLPGGKIDMVTLSRWPAS